MATFNIVVARSKFNLENDLTKFIREGVVTLRYFETQSNFRAPKKFKIITNQNDDIKEYYFELELNSNNSYLPHNFDLKFNSFNTKISIIALPESIENIKESISYRIIFENIDDGDEDEIEYKPMYIPDSKLQYV